MEQINDIHIALELLKTNILLATNYQNKRLFFLKSNNMILVINETKKYYITINDFINEFSLFTFYLYKSYDEIDINQEFLNLRQ